jgi:hypothetical protein
MGTGKETAASMVDVVS